MAKGNFFSELKRRNVLRVGAAYAVASFAMIEVVSNVAPALSLPDWTLKLVIVLLALGFPGVVTFAWIYELTPEGLKRTADVENNVSIAHQTGHRLNIVIIGLFLILAGVYGVERFLLTDKAADGAVRTSADAPAKQSTPEGISIAVLPFVNLSSDPEQEFFSDGMTEEITSALAKVQRLRVVGRTSAFEFKGQNKDLRAIGQALGAGHLLEGSVRREGNQIRVTAQLIKADDGTHVWTDNYDRELKGVFAIQDEIAQAIAGALQVPLGLKQGRTLVANRDIDPENYQKYLRAKALYRARGNVGSTNLRDAVNQLEDLVASAPDHAPAWALLSLAYVLSAQETNAFMIGDEDALKVFRAAGRAKAQTSARRAIALDPSNADAHVGLALSTAPGKPIDREDWLKRALDLDAYNPEALQFYSVELAFLGRIKDALTLRERLGLIEPLVPVFNANTAYLLSLDGQNERALAVAKALPESLGNRPGELSRAYAGMGKYGEAADALNQAADRETLRASNMRAAAHLLRQAPGPVRGEAQPDLGAFSYAYTYVGAAERAAASLVREGVGRADYLHRSYAGVRKTATFKAWAREIGLVDYWRARGWPDLCRPVGADDFECD